MNFLDQFGDEEALTVSEYTRRIKTLLETGIGPSWVNGEVSNFRRQSSGHLYFTLKDQNAQLPCVMFRGNASSLSFDPEDGLEVLAFGEISVYEPYGRYQLVVRALVESGAGKLHREFERLKKKLQGEGLFDKDSKKSLPLLPRAIAIITSPTGAAVQDFIRILKRRGWRGRLILIPCKVQGQGSADEIVNSLQLADTLGFLDLIVVGRGGGSLEDLWCFNEEKVVRAIHDLGTPVISAVGHEIDFTLSDFAADARAETPSAAAELISSAFLESEQTISEIQERVQACVDWKIQELRQSFTSVAAKLSLLSPRATVETSYLKLDDIANRLNSGVSAAFHRKSRNLASSHARFNLLQPSYAIASSKDTLNNLNHRIHGVADKALAEVKSCLSQRKVKLEALSPQATLKRGYALFSDEAGRPICRAEDVPESDSVEATFHDGSVWLRKDLESS